MKRIFRLVFCTNEVYSLLHLFGETISRGPEKGEIKLILLNNQKQKYYNTFCTTSINVLYRFRHVQIKVPVGPVSSRSVPGVQCLAQEPIMVMFFYDMDHHGDMQIQNKYNYNSIVDSEENDIKLFPIDMLNFGPLGVRLPTS